MLRKRKNAAFLRQQMNKRSGRVKLFRFIKYIKPVTGCGVIFAPTRAVNFLSKPT